MLPTLYLFILLSPLLNSFILGLQGRFIGHFGARRLTAIFFSASFISCWVLLWQMLTTKNFFPYYINLYTWLAVNDINCNFELLIDPLTLIMFTVIITISTVVHFFAFEYLESDPHIIRFLSLLSLFTFFMLLLVSAANLTLLFFGWEGVGILSYLLISFWYNRVPSLKSAIKAVLFNKIGDIALLFAIGLLLCYSGSTDFAVIKALIPQLATTSVSIWNYQISCLALIGALIIIAAIGKSAQLSLHLWLPDAMEGPTPVSALLHAATMVTAGVFLLLRCHMIIDALEFAKIFLLILGLSTAFGAGILSAMSTDLKKSIAYSTCSQLGYMFFACGAGLFSLSLYHLFNHAFYKALLFIAAGRLIAVTNAQDSRYMANSAFILPLNTLYQVIAGLSLAGVPAFSGFYSKEIILDQMSTLHFHINGTYSISILFFIFGSLAAFLTAYYTGNQIIQLFSESFMQEVLFFIKNIVKKTSFTFYTILLECGLLLLVLASIFSGVLFYEMFTTLDIFEHSVYYNQTKLLSDICFIDLELGFFETIPLYCSLGGFLYCFIKIRRKPISASFSGPITSNLMTQPITFFWIEQKLYFEFWCCEFLIYKTFNFAFLLLKNIEKGVLEYLYTQKSFKLIRFLSFLLLKSFQTGKITVYISITLCFFMAGITAYTIPFIIH